MRPTVKQSWKRSANAGCRPVPILTDTTSGLDAITDLIIGAYSQMGPRTFKVLAEPQIHYQSGCFRWLAIRSESYPVEGIDYFEFDGEHRITRIVDFLKNIRL